MPGCRRVRRVCWRSPGGAGYGPKPGAARGAEGAGARVREACAGMLARATDPGWLWSPGGVRRSLAVAVLGPVFQHGRGPRVQLAIGGLPGIDVHKHRRLLVYRNRKFQGKVARLPLLALAIFPVRQHGPVEVRPGAPAPEREDAAPGASHG